MLVNYLHPFSCIGLSQCLKFEAAIITSHSQHEPLFLRLVLSNEALVLIKVKDAGEFFLALFFAEVPKYASLELKIAILPSAYNASLTLFFQNSKLGWCP